MLGSEGGMNKYEVEGAMEQRELESLRAWKQTILRAPDTAKEVIAARFRQSMKIKPLIDEWRRKVLTLEAENAALTRDAACFEALYEMSDVSWKVCGREWQIRFNEKFSGDPESVYAPKDRERFRRAIEAGIPA
jgi:hypothetical protein